MKKHIFPRGQFKILRADSSTELVNQRPTIRGIQAALKYDMLDSVNLRDGTVMMVSDIGMIDGLPVNSEATALYHSICKPGTIYSIHGDAALVWDEDFT